MAAEPDNSLMRTASALAIALFGLAGGYLLLKTPT